MNTIQYDIRGRVAVLTIKNPPVNALGSEVQSDLRAALERVICDPAADAAVLIGEGQTFVAGADIRNLQAMAQEGRALSNLPEILAELELAPKPVIAAIQGHALGAGLELALAAHYRIGRSDAKLGQPEVKLGIIPGAGGTQRLARLAGLETAIRMCAYGDPISGEQAFKAGIVDRLAEGDLMSEALLFAGDIASQPLRRTRNCTDKLPTPEAAGQILAAARAEATKKNKDLVAPLAAIDAIEGAVTLPFEEGCRKEREIFSRLLGSDQAKALVHVFFAERAAARIPGLDKDLSSWPIRGVAVIGAGTMGRGIAMCFANAGIPVRLKDKEEALTAASSAIDKIYEGSVGKGRMSAAERDLRKSRITFQTGYDGFDAADLIVEAVFENMVVKNEVFRQLDAVARPDAILATNTSYLDIDQIANASQHPERVIGLHFFSPANVMRLLEIVPGKATDKQILGTAFSLVKKLGKLGIMAGNCPGFIGNRILRVYRREAQLLLEEGATPKQIDTALETFGMAMGPFAVQDLAGIDIAMSSRDVFAASEAGIRQPRVVDELFRLGRYGRKTGSGWYKYENGALQVDPFVDEIIDRVRAEDGATSRTITPDEIIDRTVLGMVNEGARILEEGFALRSSDIDLVLINGYGFPSWRGGPMQYADARGLSSVLAVIGELEQTSRVAWKGSSLLKQLAETNRSFRQYDAGK